MQGLKINFYSMIMTVIIVLYSVSAEARVFDNIVVTPSLFERDLASYMLAFIIITTFTLFYFISKLDSQSGKGYAVSKFAKRQKDKKQATKKRAIAARDIEHLKNEMRDARITSCSLKLESRIFIILDLKRVTHLWIC
jgi:hypothetical protein